MNLVILKGNLGGDPDVRTFENGDKFCRFSLATSENYTNRDGEKVTSTDWHNVFFSGPVCDTIKKFFKKGDQIIITGKIKYRTYTDKDGNDKNVTEVKADRFEFCGGSERKPEEKKSTAMSDINELPGTNAEDDPSFVPE